jgi:cellulose synthase operon protein C
MASLHSIAPMPREPSTAELAELETLYRLARFLDAHGRLADFSPPEMWRDTKARIFAGRLLGNLGAARRAQNLTHATWEREPANIAARCFYAYGYAERHGSLEALRVLEEWQPTLPKPDAEANALEPPAVFLWLLRARLLAQFRDFDAAEPWLAAAERARADDPWTQVEKAAIRLHEDRYEEAVAAAERALVLRPDYRPGVEMLAQAWTLRDREAEAIELLQRALTTSQSGSTAFQLAGLLSEHARFAEAQEVLLAAERFWPLAEKPLRQALRAHQADVCHRLGRDAEAVTHARQVPGRFYETVATRLVDPAYAGASGRRHELPVGFVRQHHMTCAPATLSAVSAFLGRPIDHLELAKVITYDGTPDHEERHWLETHGWHVREFRVTWESAVALLDRGLPFTMVTTWVRSAHLQAVIGYDAALGTLVIRDPYHRAQSEALAAEFFEQQAPYGPRGMVMIPSGGESRLDGIKLPDAPLFDEWYALRQALATHDRAAAERHAFALEAAAPAHRLALWVRRALAYYDDNPLRIHECVIALRRLFPQEPNLQLEELSILQRLGQRAEHLERLREQALARGADPVFWREYAEALRADAREHQRARRYARRLMRVRPFDWLNLLTFANVLWDARDFAAATRVYRLAATLGDKAESAWQPYFAAARLSDETETAIELLRTRWHRLGAASALPAQTLCRALNQLDRTSETFEVVAAALAQRPDDGGLRIFAAEQYGRIGEFTRASEYLAAARDRVPPAEWLPNAAWLAAARAEHSVALGYWRELLANDPLHTTALRETARLLNVTANRDAALAWLAEQVTRFPHFLPLRAMRLEWLRAAPAPVALAEVESYLALHPHDAWALREQALILLRARRPDDALASALLAEQIDPRAPASAGIVGQVLLAQRRFAEARAATERGLHRSIDADWLMPQLLETCPTFEARRAAVNFLREELSTQASLGQGFLQFRNVATGVLPPDELRAALDALRQSQSEHWEAWSASIQQALAQGRGDDALALAEEATRRFPLLPRLWLDLADVRRFRNELVEETAAVTRTLEISPGWAFASRRLAKLHLRALKTAEAERALVATLSHDPLDATLLTDHASGLWQAGRQTEAMREIERAIALAPAYTLPWALLTQWARARHEPDRMGELVRRLIAERPGDPLPHARLAQELITAGQFSEVLDAARTAVSLDASQSENHDLVATALTHLGRYEEALAACQPADFGETPPHDLRGRRAWVEWQRGNRRGAVEQMRAVLDAAPDYSWGWQQLSDWLDALDDKRAAAEAAERLAALNPGSAVPLGYIADLKLKAGDKLGAAEYLRRALRVDPGYTFAAFTLLRIVCDLENWPDAQQLLALIRQHASRWHALRCEVLFHRCRRDRLAASQSLRELCAAPAHETDALTGAADYFVAAGWTQALATTLAAALRSSEANPEVGALWMRAVLQTSEWPPLRRLGHANVRDEIRRRAFVVYVEWLGEKSWRLRLLWQLVRRRAWLRAEDSTWGSVGYALVRLRLSRWHTRWMADWPQRKNLHPWMLFNLSLCLYNTGREGAAAQVVDAALRLPADHTRSAFVAWAAWRHARQGDIVEARRCLALFDSKTHIELAHTIAQLTESICHAHEAPREQAADTFAQIRKTLATLRIEKAGTYANKAVRRAHYATLQAVAAATRRAYWPIWLQIAKPWHTVSRPVFFTVTSGVLLLAIPIILANLPTDTPNAPPVFVVIWPLAAVIFLLVKRANGSH